jgi:hypothetical protein
MYPVCTPLAPNEALQRDGLQPVPLMLAAPPAAERRRWVARLAALGRFE